MPNKVLRGKHRSMRGNEKAGKGPAKVHKNGAQEELNSHGKHLEVRYDDDSRGFTVDARALSLPALAIVGLIGFFVYGTIQFMNEKKSISDSINELKVSVSEVQKSVISMSAALETKTAEGLKITDLRTFCLAAQIKNKDWTCPDIVSHP